MQASSINFFGCLIVVLLISGCEAIENQSKKWPDPKMVDWSRDESLLTPYKFSITVRNDGAAGQAFVAVYSNEHPNGWKKSIFIKRDETKVIEVSTPGMQSSEKPEFLVTSQHMYNLIQNKSN